jgi:hypothetical protein
MRNKDLAVKLANPKFGVSDEEAEVEFETAQAEVKAAKLELVKSRAKAIGPLVQIAVADETAQLVSEVRAMLGEDIYKARFIGWLKKTIADNAAVDVA